MTRSIFYALLLFVSPLTALGSEYYCTYFGGVNLKMSTEDISMFQLEKDGCVEGDALRLVIYDRAIGASGREVLYLSQEIVELCDLTEPVTIVGQVDAGNSEAGAYHAVCTYVGFRRRPRVPDN